MLSRRTLLWLLATSGAQACSAPSRAAEEARAPPDEPLTLPAPKPLAFRGPVAKFRLTNDNGAPLAPRVVSFGQVFPPQRVAANTVLAVSLEGREAPAQLDAKAFYPDGSVRHGIVSVQVPPMTRGATFEGLVSAADPQERSSGAPAGVPPLEVVLTLAGGASPRQVVMDLAKLSTAPGSSRPPPWLHGPLAHEQRYAAAPVEGIQVDFDVWTPAVGPPRIDVIFHNDSAQNAEIATRSYDVRISLAGEPVYVAAGLKHRRYQTWRAVVHAGGALPPRVTPDTRQLVELGAVPHYGRFRPDAGAMRELHERTLKDRASPGWTGVVTRYMPQTGGRADIGPLPAWAAFYVLDPSKQNHETLFANAEVAGAIPWHVRDMTTGGPISIDHHPGVWLDDRGKPQPPVLNRKYEPDDGVWTIDDAHQPSLTYLPYLLSGSQYYRDELTMQAGHVLLAVNSGYRGGAAGIVLPSQLRAIAWDLRTLATAAYILPADDRFQRYFQAKLEGNLREIIRRFVKGAELTGAGELTGYVPGGYDEQATAPWQDDYLAIVLGWTDGMGFRDARTILAWMSNFVAGRFTNAERGFDPIYGTPSTLHIVDASTGRRFDTWSAAFKASFDPSASPVTELNYADWAGGYAALARAALASILNAAPSPRAEAAYAYVKAQSRQMDASFSREPAFAIVPIADRAP